MTQRPRILDLFCGEGGASRGFFNAGFDPFGVDLESEPLKLYPYQHLQADVLMLADLEPKWWAQWDAIHASPPCQAHTTMSVKHRGKGGKADDHVNLIPQTREILRSTGLPYVIENVAGAKSEMIDPVTLTGGMFGLRVHRPRLFESNVDIPQPPKCPSPKDVIGVYGRAPDGRLLWRRKDGTEQRAASSVNEARAAMGMPWASWRGCAEAIPPAYAEFIGRYLLAAL